MSWTARDEKVTLIRHPARIGYTSKYLGALVIFLVAIFLLYLLRHAASPLGFASWTAGPINIGSGSYYFWWPSLILIVIAVLILLVTELHRRSIVYTVTTRRVGIKKGMLSKSVEEASLAQIQDIHVHQSAFQRLLNVGNLEVRTEVGGQGVIWLWNVPKPREFERAIFTK